MKARHIALVLIMLILAGCSTAPVLASEQTTTPATEEGVLDGTDLDALVEAARKEGSVVVYSFTSRIATVKKAFEEAYPEIDFFRQTCLLLK
jgi:PBP1b-binding outer membrane lipoprotein LpoB